MNINIYEEKFVPVKDIILIKTYLKRLSDYKVLNDSLLGSIFLDLSYFDSNMQENFKTIELEFAVILKDSINIESITLNDVKCELVDLKGVNINYNLEIDYVELLEDLDSIEIKDEKSNEDEETFIDEYVEEIIDNNNDDLLDEEQLEAEYEEIDDEIIELREDEVTFIEDFKPEKKDEEIIQIKEELKQEYDDKLKESLKERITITRPINETEDSFLDIFNTFEARFLCIKKMLVREDMIDEVLKENEIDLKDKDEFYDKSTNILTIKSYE